MSTTPITDYETRAKAKLLAQYQGKPIFEAVVEALAAEVQELETALQTLYVARYLATAEGEQLDVLGSIVGQERGALSDEDFRSYISARIKLNNSNGTIPEIVSIFEDLTAQFGSTIELHEDFPAAFLLRAYEEGIGTTNAAVMLEFLHLARGAGIYSVFEYQTHSDADTFDWFENATGTGWTDEATGLLGGYWADAVSSDA